MIEYYAPRNMFLLEGKTFSYVMRVNEAGFLQFLHYGKRVDRSHPEYLADHYGAASAPSVNDPNMDMILDWMQNECGAAGRGDFREATVILERDDGAFMSRFRFVSYKIYDGVPTLPGLPHARKGQQTLSVTLRDDFSAVDLTLNYSVFEDSDILVRNLEIHNIGEPSLKIRKAFSFCTDLPDSDYRLLRLEGRWAQERIIDVTPIGKGIVRLESIDGYSSHEMNPFLGLLRSSYTETEGVCYGFNLLYSGSFALTCQAHYTDVLRIQGGINDSMFAWVLKKGERFVTPQAVLCFSAEGLGAMSRSYADFFRECILPPEKVYQPRPIVINNWEATYFDFTYEKLYRIIDEAAVAGIDTFVLDDGWFHNRRDDRAGLGDWFVDTLLLKDGLDPIIEYCKKKGLKFGLWFEPEMVNENSDLFREHPDWALCKAGVEPCRGRNQLVLDFTRPEIVDAVFNAVSDILRHHEISYVKWDKNRLITEWYSAHLSPERQGEVMHRYTLGVYNLAQRLTEAFPHILFEGCASGGGRFDGGMLYYFPQIWTSDDTDAYERAKIQYGTSIVYPLSSMSAHVSVCPNHQTQRITPLQTRGAIASLACFGYELDLSKLTDAEKQEVRGQVEAYRDIADLILRGDLYRLANPSEGNYFAMMVVAKDKSKAYVAGMRIHGVPCDKNHLLALQGLDEEKLYRVRPLNIVAKGITLMSFGLLLPRLADFGSWTWTLEEEQ